MNSVSFLLWISDIVQNLQMPLTFLAIFTFLLAGSPFVFAMFGVYHEPKKYTKETRDSKTGERTTHEITYSEWYDSRYSFGSNTRAEDQNEVWVRFFPKARRWAWLTIPLFLIVFSASVIRPERNTLLAIAASEYAEDFAATPVGGEVGELALDTLKLLRQKLGEELNKVAQ
jgi:hypothetical protein